MARQLRAAGHLIYVTTELGLDGADDDVHLARATELGAVPASQNQSDFDPLHDEWQKLGRRHAGLLVSRQLPIGVRIRRLERAARLLRPEIAENQLMKLAMFDTEERRLLFVQSLAPSA